MDLVCDELKHANGRTRSKNAASISKTATNGTGAGTYKLAGIYTLQTITASTRVQVKWVEQNKI